MNSKLINKELPKTLTPRQALIAFISGFVYIIIDESIWTYEKIQKLGVKQFKIEVPSGKKIVCKLN